MKNYCKEHLYKDYDEREHDEGAIKARLMQRLERVNKEIKQKSKKRKKPCIVDLRR